MDPGVDECYDKTDDSQSVPLEKIIHYMFILKRRKKREKREKESKGST